jgi:glycosyltransferase involved in cell wall biosynthesis
MRILIVGKLYLYEVYGNTLFKEDAPASRRRILGLIDGLGGMGVSIDVLSPMAYSPLKKIYCPPIEIKYRGANIRYPATFNICFFNYLYMFFAVLINLFKMHRKNKYDAVIFYNPLFYRGYPSIIFGKIKNVPVVMDYEDLICSEYSSNKIVRNILGLIEKDIVKHVDKYVLASGAFIEKISPKSDYIIIRSGCYSRAIEEGAHGSIGEKNIIMYSGKLDAVRGVDMLIESMKYIKSKDYQVVVTGAGPLAEYLKDAEKKNPNLSYKGYLSEEKYSELLNSALILVNTQKSKYDFSKYCFPSKLYEYMAAGKYVISTAVSDVKRHLGDKIFILEKDEPAALAETIDYIIANKTRLSGVRLAAQKYVIEEENWMKQAKKLIGFIEKLIGENMAKCKN